MAKLLEGITGHPRALYMLFFTEMWERFTFYGMRALLILFMTSQLFYPDAKANHIYGSYQALVYAMPLFGGMLADRLLGFRRSIVFGGIIMALGSFVMAIPSEIAFYAGMGFIVVGNGFFKPNISSIVGKLYAPEDPRRDSGFSLFYMGINLGALAGGLICGYIGQNINWHLGFGVAGLFMLLGLFVFNRGKHLLGDKGEAPNDQALSRPSVIGLRQDRATYLLAFLCAPLFAFTLWHYEVMDYVFNPLGIAALVYLLYLAFTQVDKVARQQMLAAIVMIIFSVLFWGFYEQAGGSLNLFALRNVDLSFFGGQNNAAAVNNSVNPLLIILLSPVFAALWVWLSSRRMEPGTPMKFGLAFLQLALGFYMFILGGQFADNGMVPVIYFVLGYMFLSSGELCLSPIGLSMITKLSPAKLVGMMMGAWFLASAFGQFVAGKVGAMMAMPTVDGETTLPPAESLAIYSGVFKDIAWISLGAGVVMIALVPVLKKWMHGIR
ncbi:MAG: peptide MFS transporter [Flavobacteriales bacterium]|jgi:POT family proton-dependent oligopeptide transporter|nr:peptide MFS transporter [Flavobacteriales bacterium]